MAGKYASGTTVSSELSRLEIERVLVRYGADQFAYAMGESRAMIAFRLEARQIRFLLPLPTREEYRYTPGRHVERSEKSWQDAWEQACRQRWRALLLVVKAKLEDVECGISTVESEFMAHIVLPGGETVGDFMAPQIQRAYELGEPPGVLPLPGGGKGNEAYHDQ